MQQGNRYAERRQLMYEILGSIERVNHPTKSAFPISGTAFGFFPPKLMLREPAKQNALNFGLGSVVRLGNQVAGGLFPHGRSAQGRHQDAAGGLGGS
jgi:hypothetical protein